MTLDPEQKLSMQKSLQVARIIWFTFCFAVPLLLLLGYGLLVLHGHPAAFLAGFSGVPWKDPIVYGFIIVAVATLAVAAIFPERLSTLWKFKDTSIFYRLRIRHLWTCALLETIPFYGLALGLLLGPGLASLALAFLVVPMVAGCMIYPNENDWRYRFKLAHEHF